MEFPEALKIFNEGETLQEQETRQLESILESAPSDVVSRIKLLGYYRAHPDSSRYATHLGWIVDNRVDDEDIVHFAVYNRLRGTNDAVYDRLTVHWLRYLESNLTNTAAILNAAQFFNLNDDFKLALACMEKLETCVLKESDFLSMASLYEQLSNMARRSGDEPFEAGLFHRAIAWCAKATSLDDDTCRASTKLVTLLFAANRFTQAKDTATRLLKRVDKNDLVGAYSIHVVNVTLGKIALLDGDLPTAVCHLGASLEIPHSPSLLAATGPDMTLAEALLEKGEKQPVLSFLDECDKFSLSANSHSDLQHWREAIAAGRKPY